MPSTWN